MALLQISEPGQTDAPHQHRFAAGIDLGTTNSLVATVRSGQVDVLEDSQGHTLLPSTVRYTASRIIVGEDAKAAEIQDPLNTISSVKRLMGRSKAELSQADGHFSYQFNETDSAVPKIKTAKGDVTAIEVSAEILKNLAQRAEQTLGDKLSGVVITVPAYFDENQRQATKDAATLAGLNVYRLLNEPTAAAVAYGLDSEAEGIHAIYDLGGGTFDISILRLNKGIFEVLATGGNSALGGDDFDHVIANWIQTQAQITELTPPLEKQILSQARLAKEALTNIENTEIQLNLAEQQKHISLNIGTLNTLLTPLVKKTLIACRKTLRDAGISTDEIIDLVMVGGSTRVPLVRQMVGTFFNLEPLVSIDPDKVVAIGAAQQADILAGNQNDRDLLLLDVIPLSLGIETMGGLTEKIIHRNTTIPVARAQEFTTFKDGQTAMKVHIVQGERELVKDCRSLAHFELRGIPPMVAGAARIQVTYAVDADGLLHVEAEELTQHIKSSIDVKPSYGLTDDEVANMLAKSIEYAEADIQQRQLRELQVDAMRVIEALHSALHEDGEKLLDASERRRIDQALNELTTIAEKDNSQAIEKQIKHLEKTCEFYVERRMNNSVQHAMAGHKLDEFEE